MSDGVLSKSWRTRIIHRNHVDQLMCFRCGKEIQVGDRIHTNGNCMHSFIKPSKLKKMRVYHRDCYEEMFIEC